MRFLLHPSPRLPPLQKNPGWSYAKPPTVVLGEGGGYPPSPAAGLTAPNVTQSFHNVTFFFFSFLMLCCLRN